MKNTQDTLTDTQYLRRLAFGVIGFFGVVILFVGLILGASIQHDNQLNDYNNTRKVRQQKNIQNYNSSSSSLNVQNNE